MTKPALIALLAATGIAATARAYEFRSRWVLQTGPGVDDFEVLPGNTISVTPGSSNRFRLQLGVFADAAGPAPAGGLLGWNVGTLTDSAPAEGTNTRTPGRLSPYRFAPSSGGANGLPTPDPWTTLTGIDNTLGIQITRWPMGQPAPDPPLIRGLDSFVSVYEITSIAGPSGYTIAAAGNGFAATGWVIIQQPPAYPDDDSVYWGPAAAPPVPFSVTLHITVPAPGAAALLGLASLAASRRRRP